MKKVLIVVGTRPNFIKVTQFRKLAAQYPGIQLKIAHTGQHFAPNMADVFFGQLDLFPDYYLKIDTTSVLQQMGDILIRLGELIEKEFRPDLIIVPGDVNSTLAVAIVANKLGIPLAHLESGLRSFDRTMPEEINRILTDELSDYYFVTEPSGVANLEKENKKGQIHFVGNTMIDTLVAFDKQIDECPIIENLGIRSKFVLVTIHRPVNVDGKEGLEKLLALIRSLGEAYQLVFPVHPRTRKNMEKYGLTDQFSQMTSLLMVDALGYFEFQKLIRNCSFVLTDSGGIQEETTFHRVPCLTLRDSTERPITTTIGSNTLVPFEVEVIRELVRQIENGVYKKGMVPDLWDGKATARILAIVDKL